MSAILAVPVPIEVMAMAGPGRGRLLTARRLRRPGTRGVWDTPRSAELQLLTAEAPFYRIPAAPWTVYHRDADGRGVAGPVAAVNTTTRAWTLPALDGEIYGEPRQGGPAVSVGDVGRAAGTRRARPS